jgi:hypothetical protein
MGGLPRHEADDGESLVRLEPELGLHAGIGDEAPGMEVGELVQSRVPVLRAGKRLLEGLGSADSRRPGIGEDPVRGDVLGVREHDGRGRGQPARGRDERASDRGHDVGPESPNEAHEGGQAHRVLAQQAAPGRGEDDVIESEGAEEGEGDVLVARGEHDLVSVGPEPGHGVPKEMHVAGMAKVHEHAHARAG